MLFGGWYMIWCDIWYDVMWYDMIVYVMIWYDIYDMLWCDMIWCDMIWYGMVYDMIWYDTIRCDVIYDMIYLTAIGLPLGGSSRVHIYTQTIHRTIQSTLTIHGTTQFTNSH
jgi:hypothetical protein